MQNNRITNEPTKTVRASVSLSVEMHAELERIAAKKKVSLSWVLRDAAEKYITDQYPLFENRD